MDMIMNNYWLVPLEERLLKRVKVIVFKHTGKHVIKGTTIRVNEGKGKIKACKLDIENSAPMRVDFKYKALGTKLQIIANTTNIEIPKVLFIDTYKFSEWIEGIGLNELPVEVIPKAFNKLGHLVGKLHGIKHKAAPLGLMNSEVNGVNGVWTPDEKVYMIDLGRLKKVQCSKDLDMNIVQICLKRLRNRKHIALFLEAYSEYRDITNIKKIIEEKNWIWKKKKKNIK